MTPLIDICFNLTHECFRNDDDTVIARAQDAGVCHMAVPGVSVDDSAAALKLLDRYPELLRVGAGTHPHMSNTWTHTEERRLNDLASDPRIGFIGEIGLDYHRSYSSVEQQIAAFEQQLEIAATHHLPVFLHQRDAHDDFVVRLKAVRAHLPRAVVHCFTGNETELREYLNLDCHIGITGWICDERRGTHLRSLVRLIPLSHLMIETDSPFLAPRDLRPKVRRNEPCHLPHIAKTLASYMGLPFEKVAHHTHQNARQFFGFA